MKSVYISIGGNIGDRVKNLRNAIVMMHEEKEITVTKVSSFYETEPWGKTDQPKFLNAALKILTTLKPEVLLMKLQNIEQKLGRTRHERWRERTVDIDVIHYEDLVMESEFIKLPHPYFKERKFVLIPLYEIAPKLKIDDVDIKTYLSDCKDELAVLKTAGSPKDFQMTAIACVNENGGIGFNNQLLYKIKADMTRFHELTLNNILIVGKNTFQEMGKLDKRIIIVMSRTEKFSGENIYTANSVAELFSVLDGFSDKKIFIAGGEDIFRLLIPYAARAEITKISDNKPSDKFFPHLYDFTLQKILMSEDQEFKLAFCSFSKE